MVTKRKKRFAMNDDFYKQRAREVRDIAAKADPFIKQRLLELADRYDVIAQDKRYALTASTSGHPNLSGEHDGNPATPPLRHSTRQNSLARPGFNLQPEQIENQPVSPERVWSETAKRNPFASRLPWPMQNTNAPVRERDWR